MILRFERANSCAANLRGQATALLELVLACEGPCLFWRALHAFRMSAPDDRQARHDVTSGHPPPNGQIALRNRAYFEASPAGYFKFPQKRWMRRQASSKSSVLVA